MEFMSLKERLGIGAAYPGGEWRLLYRARLSGNYQAVNVQLAAVQQRFG
jgi:hypothetical protein